MTESLSEDRFELRIYSTVNPLVDWQAARAVLEILVREGGELAPTTIWKNQKSDVPFNLETARLELARTKQPVELYLGRQDNGMGIHWIGYSKTNPASEFVLTVPFAFVADPTRAEARAARIFALTAALCRACPPLYGWGHSHQDVRLGNDPNVTNAWAPKEVVEAYWLTILGAPMVRRLTRARVAATPAYRVDFLDDGSALILIHPLPGEFASRPARDAQAKVLAHLRLELNVDEILRVLLDRSARLQPVERRWDPDLAHLFQVISEFTPLATRRAKEIELNNYRPPEITEWLPAAQALPTDVDDVERVVDSYHREGERFVMGFHDQITGLAGADPDSLPAIDVHFYLYDYTGTKDPATVEQLMLPTLGAHLGNLIERFIDGRWIPRRILEESQVLVGDRAWLPFLRVKRFLQSKQAVVDYSLTKYYREAERHGASMVR